ncbi:MAG: hypothetical protein ACKV0T_08155 [Planctomycetales bacterium]
MIELRRNEAYGVFDEAPAGRSLQVDAMAFVSRLFSVCPRVTKSEGKLVAETAWRVRVGSLGALYRKVVVDPGRKVVTIDRRYGWAFARRSRLRFESIEAITYGYEDWGYGAGWSVAHDSVDLFSVGLRLFDGEERRLFYFFGDGTFSNTGPWPDWLFWDEYLLNISGSQERESRGFVDLLGKMIGVPVVPPRS